jgi:hypothetical protein
MALGAFLQVAAVLAVCVAAGALEPERAGADLVFQPLHEAAAPLLLQVHAFGSPVEPPRDRGQPSGTD